MLVAFYKIGVENKVHNFSYLDDTRDTMSPYSPEKWTPYYQRGLEKGAIFR